MKRPPTDFELLRAIWRQHRDEFAAEVDVRETRVFVPIDIPAIASELGVDPHSIFGRLYHHLEQIYGEKPGDMSSAPRKAFFTPKLGTTANCVNFPLLEAVLAGLWQQ